MCVLGGPLNLHEINNQQYYIAQFINTHANMGFPCGSMVKNPPAVREPQEIWVQSLGSVSPLALHSPPSPMFTVSNLPFSQCRKNNSLLPCYPHMQRLGLLIREQEMLLLKGTEGARRGFGPLLQQHHCPHPACVMEEIFSDLLRYCLLGSECLTFPPKKITPCL